MNNQKDAIKISDIAKARKEKLAIRKEYMKLFKTIILLVLATYLIFTQIFLVIRIKGNDMFPALKDGDLAIVFRIQGEYLKNDVISYVENESRYIGRIVARQGDVVIIEDNGTLQVNGSVQVGEIIYPTYIKEGIEYPYRVPENSVFVLGDYRTQSIDSRDFGAVSKADIEGKIITILRRRGI